VFSMIIIRIGLGITTPSGETNLGGTSMVQTTTSYNVHGSGKNEPVELGFVTTPKSGAKPNVSVSSSQNTVEFRREVADRGELCDWQVCKLT
jgi:hypothetical protein